LNSSFSVDGPLLANNYYQTASPKQWDDEGVFFQDADETMLYSFGGYNQDEQIPDPIETLNTYNIAIGEWSNITVSGGAFNYGARKSTTHAISTGSSEALSFNMGGGIGSEGMIRFDASDPANPTWRNEVDPEPPYSFEGSMEFIRYGRNGSLINFRGYKLNYTTTEAAFPTYDPRPLDEINVYDIESARWFNVTASGDIPNLRTTFCTAVSYAPDDSSVQITLYGGYDMHNKKRTMADTYTLTIPSFHWLNVTSPSSPDGNLAAGIDLSGRLHHRCATYKERQMLVLGGTITIGDASQNMSICDDRFPPLRALDLSTFQFTNTWNGSPEPYYVPDAVTRVIGGDGSGGAVKNRPSTNFNDSALDVIFGNIVPRYTPIAASLTLPDADTNNTNTTNTTNPPTNPDSNTRKSNLTPILAGVLSGLALLAALLVTTLVLLRRRRRKQKALASPPPQQPFLPAWDGTPQEMRHVTQGPKELHATSTVGELHATSKAGELHAHSRAGELPG
jgi:hypothetical protein